MKNMSVRILTVLPLLVFCASLAPRYEVGDIVESFTLKNIDGKMVSLADYKSSKGVIVIFDCNTCPFSKAYNARIQALNKNFAPKGFPVVAINANDAELSPGDSFAEMVAMAKKNNINYPYLTDESQQVARAFGATNTPHVFVLVRNSNDFKVVYKGAIDDNSRDASAAGKKYVEDAVNAVLESKSVPTPRTKAIGCGIKWRDV